MENYNSINQFLSELEETSNVAKLKNGQRRQLFSLKSSKCNILHGLLIIYRIFSAFVKNAQITQGQLE